MACERCTELERENEQLTKERDEANEHIGQLDAWIRLAVDAAAPFQEDPALRRLLTIGDSTVRDGLKLGIEALQKLTTLLEQGQALSAK